MPRIFKYGDIQNISFTPDYLNILIYLIIYRSHTLLKMIRFFGPPCILLKMHFAVQKDVFLALKYGKTRWRPGLRPGPHWGELTTLP